MRSLGISALQGGEVQHTQGSYQGKPYDHVGRFTHTWVQDLGKWQCVASHTSLMKK
jgi:hypothetical protein